MSVLVFIILFGISGFVVFLCEGKIFLPPQGDTFLVGPGTDVKIAWRFDDKISDLTTRAWRFIPTGKLLAVIQDDQYANIKDSGLPGVEIEKPSTLVLKNVDLSHNGTYKFQIFGKTLSDPSYVTVIVAAKPTMTVCSTSITVDEDENVRCLCKGEGGQPSSNVTWYKDGIQIGDTGDEEQTLSLVNVNNVASGTYKCVGQSYTLKAQKSFQVTVRPNVPPKVLSITSGEAVFGKSVTLKCDAEGRPSPSYTIIHNETRTVSTQKTYTIDEVKYSHAGLYECSAKNKLGDDSIVYKLTVSDPTNSSNKVESKNVVVWHVVVSLLSGIVIGLLLACIMVTVYFRRRYRNKKPAQTNVESQSSNKVDSIYQDLDLNKMNEVEHYEPLRTVNSDDPEGQNESDYTELNLARDVEDNYQSLTST